MKKQFYLYIIMGLCGLIALSSCKKITPVAPFYASTPLQALINSDTSLSVYYAAVKKSGDSILYKGVDSVIVLILTNTAFAAQGITAATINAMPVTSVDSLLRYHFIAGPATLTAGTYSAYTNKLGNIIYGYGATDSTGYYFNGVPAALQKLSGSNATVFELNQSLQLPPVTINQLIAADTSLTLFAEALKQTHVNLSPTSGWNTVLAPVDSAFAGAGYPDISSIDTADIGRLTGIVQYHLLAGQYFANSFTGLSNVTASNGNTINLLFNNGAVNFFGSDSTKTAAILVANRFAANNIILHIISGVLMP